MTDVLAAYAMGASLAVAFFLQTFDHPFGARAGCLVGESAAAAAAPADEQQAAGYAPIEAEEAAP